MKENEFFIWEEKNLIEPKPNFGNKNELETQGTTQNTETKSEKKECESIGKKEKLREAYKKYYNSDKGKKRARRYWLENKKKILDRRMELYRNLSKEELEKIRKRDENTRLKNVYGITLEGYSMLLDKQKSKCAICGKNSPAKKHTKFNIDHDHNTGKIRGLLCTNCNRALGFFNDDVNLLNKAIQYLQYNANVPAVS